MELESKELGNTEFLNCFLITHYSKYQMFEELEDDSRVLSLMDNTKNILKNKWLKTVD